MLTCNQPGSNSTGMPLPSNHTLRPWDPTSHPTYYWNMWSHRQRKGEWEQASSMINEVIGVRNYLPPVKSILVDTPTQSNQTLRPRDQTIHPPAIKLHNHTDTEKLCEGNRVLQTGNGVQNWSPAINQVQHQWVCRCHQITRCGHGIQYHPPYYQNTRS